MKDMHDYQYDDEDEEEDDDDFVSNHAVSNKGGRIEELESDQDVWGDNYFGVRHLLAYFQSIEASLVFFLE